MLVKTGSYTKHQLKAIQKTEHNLACVDYAKIFLSIVLLVISIKSAFLNFENKADDYLRRSSHNEYEP